MMFQEPSFFTQFQIAHTCTQENGSVGHVSPIVLQLYLRGEALNGPVSQC